MNDLEILRVVLKQEVLAEKRYAEQVNNISNANIRRILSDLRGMEKMHKEEVIERIKEINVGFNKKFNVDFKEKDEKEDDNYSDLLGFLILDEEKEKEAHKLYLGFSKEVNDQLISEMLKRFIDDELKHRIKIHNLINELNVMEAK